jgi:hypothetical protein
MKSMKGSEQVYTSGERREYCDTPSILLTNHRSVVDIYRLGVYVVDTCTYDHILTNSHPTAN